MAASTSPDNEKVVVAGTMEASPTVSSGNEDVKKEGLDVAATGEGSASESNDFSAYFVSYFSAFCPVLLFCSLDEN